MKNFIFLLVICFMIACQDSSNSTSANNTKDSANANIKGAYSMTKQIVNDVTKDTLLKKEQL